MDNYPQMPITLTLTNQTLLRLLIHLLLWLTAFSTFASPVDHITTKLTDHLGGVMVGAHRGCATLGVPENSLEALKRCIEMGVDIVEADIRLSQDGTLMVIHDDTLNSATNYGPGWVHYNANAPTNNEVSAHSVADLKSLNLIDEVGNPTAERIPTLAEFLIAAKGNILVQIDKWSPELLPNIYGELIATDTFDHALLVGFKSYDETVIDFGTTIDNFIYMPGLHRDLDKSYLAGQPIGTYISEFNSGYDPNLYLAFYKTEHDDVFPHINQIIAGGRRVYVATSSSNTSAGHDDLASLADPDNGWGWHIDRGISMLLTGYPGILLSYLHSEWQYEHAHDIIYSVLPDGNIQCASYDGINCLLSTAVSALNVDNITPLVCGPAHTLVLGFSGYDTPGHWCADLQFKMKARSGVSTGWLYAENTPYRINVHGDIECASYDGVSCLNGVPVVELDPSILNPLTCGDVHRELFGYSGYDTSQHWCRELAELHGLTIDEQILFEQPPVNIPLPIYSPALLWSLLILIQVYCPRVRAAG